VSLSQATQASRTVSPNSARPSRPPQLSGHRKAFQDALGNQPLLILSALIAVYLVLGSSMRVWCTR